MRILLLDLDTLRPDHLGCYGYHRQTSPNIDAIAAQGVRFDSVYCSDAPCLPSRTAMWSGRFGICTGVVNHGGLAADLRPEGATRGFRDQLSYESLAGTLRHAGLHTASVSPFAERHSAWHFYAGFSEMHNTGQCGMESAEHITPVVLDWIERKGSQDNWFLHVNYWDPHTPYRAPADFGDPFADDPLPAWLTDEVLAEHQQCIGPHCAREIYMFHNQEDPQYPRHPGEVTDRPSLRRMIDGYDCGIRYMDDHVGRIFQALADQGVLDDTIIIITADHGENMGELGIYGEHATADEPTCHIPLIIRWPGMQQGHIDDGLHYNLDLLPTLADLLNTSGTSSWDGASPRWQGQSFADALRTGTPCGREHLVLSQCAHVCQRSVRWDNWLYIRSYHDGFHLFDEEMLFDLDNDPYEQNNLASQRPDLCQAAAHRYLNWHAAMMRANDGAPDPMQTVLAEGGPTHARGCLAGYCEHLEKTERGWAVPLLKQRHPNEFK